MQADEGFPLWCAACEWGLPQAEADRGESTVTAARGRIDLARIGAYTLATVVHTLPLGLLASATVLATAGRGVVAYGLAAVLAVLAVTLMPRPVRLDRDAEILTRDDAPHLYALFDEVTAELGAGPVHVIAITPEFNASSMALGLRRRRAVQLGLPLWRVLTPDQKVALIGHELAHGVNGDCRHGLYVGSALDVLTGLHRTLDPDELPGHEDGLMYMSRLVLTPLLWLCRGAVFLLHRGLDRTTLRSGRRAEHHADELAARVASSEAVAGLLEAMTVLEPTVAFTVRTSPVTRSPLPLWDRVDQAVAVLPDGERDRRLRLAARENTQVDDTHPPTRLRTSHVRALAAIEPRVRLSPETADRIDAELAAISTRIERNLTEAAEAALYHRPEGGTHPRKAGSDGGFEGHWPPG
ncbi:M48 family metallopeptidase [Actinocorallia populi]|uniref:M48 family metallopeptidase n=1 Tax=Actinocorallia populi TaxID=2079200 RepID=UPI001E602113|nr:M48 family metallopeptidase [Actinocorallia populi]